MFKKFENLTKDKQYEKIAESAIRTFFHFEDEIEDYNVVHNTSIKGASGVEHQIDVLYELNKGEEIKRFFVECKNYNKSLVELGDIRSFHSVIEDINRAGNNVEGIFLTSSHYQKGVVLYADFYKIKLGVLRNHVPTFEEYMDSGLNNVSQSFSKKTFHEIGFILDIEGPQMQVLTANGKDLNILSSLGIIDEEIKILTDGNHMNSVKA